MSEQAIKKLNREIEQLQDRDYPFLQGAESNTAWVTAQTIESLRLLTNQTGTRTTRAQNSILQELPDKELIAVARILAFSGSEHK